MLTNNFVSVFKNLITQYNPVGGGCYKLYNGSTSTDVYNIVSEITNLNNLYAVKGAPQEGIHGICLLIGSGTTEPSHEDYKLVNEITNYEVLSQSIIRNNNKNDSEFLDITRIIRNNTAQDITVSEIGVCIKTMQNYACASVLIAREVLESPVIVKPGEKHSFTMSLCVA